MPTLLISLSCFSATSSCTVCLSTCSSVCASLEALSGSVSPLLPSPLYSYAKLLFIAVATLCSSTFAFLIALLSAYLLDLPVDPICLSEAIPFLVITVGFDKPYHLAKTVLQNPDIDPVPSSPEPSINGYSDDVAKDPKSGSTLGLDLGTLHKELAPLERLQRLAEGQVKWVAPVAAKKIVVDAVRTSGVRIVRDYALEIIALCVGAVSGIGGLREFCYLGMFLLSYPPFSFLLDLTSL